jgi:hypothetical protein
MSSLRSHSKDNGNEAKEENDCPFCGISAAYPIAKVGNTSTSTTTNTTTSAYLPQILSPLAYCVLNTQHVLAFLDHMPITRGHILVTTRAHCEKLSDTSITQSAALGAWLPLVSRAVMRVILGRTAQQQEQKEQKEGERNEAAVETGMGDWNIVQNNGLFLLYVIFLQRIPLSSMQEVFCHVPIS